MGLLDILLGDQTGQGLLSGWLNTTQQTGTKTPTTSAAPLPSIGQTGNPAAIFNQPPSLLGNSMLGNALRGGMAGLGTVGYTGLAALGQGFQNATGANQQRQLFEQGNVLGGQQYQQGQQQIAQGNLGLGQAIANFNLWQQALYPGAPAVTYADVQNDPNKLAQIMSYQGAPPPAPSGPEGPQAPTAAPSATQQGTPATPTQAGLGGPAPASPAAPLVGQPMGGAAATGDYTPDAFKALTGFSTQDYAKLGMRMRNPAMVSEALKYDSQLAATLEHAKAVGGWVPSPRGIPLGSTLYGPNGEILQAAQIQVPGVDANNNPTTRFVTPGPGGAGMPQQGAPQNNPGNIRSGQNGAFGSYPSIGAGVDAIDQNLQAYAVHGINTLRQVISTWAPPSENDTKTLIANAAKRLGIDPDKPLNLADPNTRAQVGLAIMQQENGIKTADQGGSQPAAAASDGSMQTGLGPFQQERQKAFAERLTDWGKGVKDSYVEENRLDAIADALSKTESGAWATEKASVAAKLKAVGIVVPDNILGDPTQVQIILKDNFQTAIEAIKRFTSRPAAAELTLYQQSFANAGLQPGANKAIIAQAKGTLQWDRDAYAAAAAKLDKSPGDPDAFAYQWGKDHPIKEYVDKATASMPIFKGEAAAAAKYTEGQTATNAQTGAKVIYKGGQWVPLQ